MLWLSLTHISIEGSLSKPIDLCRLKNMIFFLDLIIMWADITQQIGLYEPKLPTSLLKFTILLSNSKKK